MAGAIASDLRGKGEEKCVCHCVLMLQSFVAFASHVCHSFYHASLGLYSPANCTCLGLRRSIPWLRCRLPGRGVFLPDMINITYHGIPP